MKNKKHDPYISVYLPVAGWKAICYSWDDEMEQYVPEQTGMWAYATREEAEADAKDWSEAEEVELRL